jgi:hypothetical protein
MIDFVAVIHWMLIVLEVGAGVVLSGIGMFLGLWTAVTSERPGVLSQPLRGLATVVGFTALYPTIATVGIGWLGPQPHGSLPLTVLAGIGSALIACLLTGVGGAFNERIARILAIVGVSLPACCTAFAYNLPWLVPMARFPAIDFF